MAPRAPNPNGCYVFLYDGDGFSGAGVVLNGSSRWRGLTQLPTSNRANWDKRIRSLRVGNTATVGVYTERDFKGQFLEFAPGTDHPTLNPIFSARIRSVVLQCH